MIRYLAPSILPETGDLYTVQYPLDESHCVTPQHVRFSEMSSSRGTATRRSNACWTCKLRRKKCDETQPRCAACASRKITCHGYNHERPEWMNEAASEKAELERIQRAVKENKRRQRRLLLQSQANARRDSSSLSTGCPPGDEPISFDDTPAPFSDAMTRSSVHTYALFRLLMSDWRQITCRGA